MPLTPKAKGLAEVEEKKLKVKANELFVKGKFQKALPLFVQLSELHPKDLRMKTKVGDILVKLERKKDAAEVYRSVAAQYAQDGMFIQAIAVNKLILQIHPDAQDISRELAYLYSRKRHEKGGGFLPGVSTVIPPIEIQEIPVPKCTESTQKKPPPTRPAEPIVIAIETKASAKTKSVEIPGRLIPFSDAVDLGTLAEVSLPPTLLFSALDPQALEMVLNLMVRREYGCNEAVCREGEAGDSIFVVCEGSLKVISQDASGKVIELSHLKEGDFFGEFGYFSDRRRHATVTGLAQGVLLELRREDLDRVVRRYPAVGKILEEFYRLRLLDTLLAKSRIFQALTPQQRQGLATQFTSKTFPKGHLLMQEGEEGHEMYLIQEGYVSVTTTKDGKTVQLAVLKEGNFCGEFSVLTDARRTADVICLTETKLLSLAKADARRFFQDHPALFHKLQEIAEKRVQGTIRALSAMTTTLGSGEQSIKSMV